MGKGSRTRAQRQDVSARSVPPQTREPVQPVNWPDGHVAVELTDLSESECVKVTVHGVDHYLHATTARELQKKLSASLDEHNAIATSLGVLGV